MRQAAVRAAAREQARLLLVAVGYLTRLPVPGWVGHGAGGLEHAARYVPLVGWGVGAAAAGVLAAASAGLPATAAALLSTAATVAATGALHEDGLADACDAAGTYTREDALRVMKDSRLGSFGALGLGLVLSCKVAALAALPPPAACAALLAAHPCSRFFAVALIAALPYARAGEAGAKARPVASGMGRRDLLVAGLCGLPPLLLLGERAGPALLLGGAAAWVMARWSRRRLGGYTGDVLGAVQQLAELGILLAALWRAG